MAIRGEAGTSLHTRRIPYRPRGIVLPPSTPRKESAFPLTAAKPSRSRGTTQRDLGTGLRGALVRPRKVDRNGEERVNRNGVCISVLKGTRREGLPRM